MDVIRKVVMLFLLLAAPLWAQAGALNLNTADAETIAKTMTGVGPAKAQRIVMFRDKNGPFTSLHDLTKVKGIGKKTIEMNSGRITVSSVEPTMAPPQSQASLQGGDSTATAESK